MILIKNEQKLAVPQEYLLPISTKGHSKESTGVPTTAAEVEPND